MTRALIAIVIITLAGFGCEARRTTAHPPRDAGMFLPETIGALALDKPEAFPPQFREAAETARLHLLRKGKKPALAFAQIVFASDGEIAIHVWPAARFGGARPQGGDGYTFYYSPKERRIVRTLKWQ